MAEAGFWMESVELSCELDWFDFVVPSLEVFSCPGVHLFLKELVAFVTRFVGNHPKQHERLVLVLTLRVSQIRSTP